MGKRNKKQVKTINEMDDETSKIVLTLLLINKGEPLNNSYKLMRILEWKFKEVNSKRILDCIKEKMYASYVIAKGVHYYSITSEGEYLVMRNKVQAREFLSQYYPAELNFITTLFDQ